MTRNLTHENLDDITRCMSDLTKRLEAMREEAKYESAPAFDPLDPLSEILPSDCHPYGPSTAGNYQADRYLARTKTPRTIRNLLRAYAHTEPKREWLSIESAVTGAKYILLRVLEASTTSPSGSLYTPVKYTMAFPLASFNRVHSVAGWTFSDKYKVLESFDVSGDTYLITLILP